MDYLKVVAELREYLADLDDAILSIRRLENNTGRRGRPVALDAAKRPTRRGKQHSVSPTLARH
jgi:hypothetical protein